MGFAQIYVAVLIAKVEAKKQLSVILIFFFTLSAGHVVISGECGTGDTWHFCHVEQNLVINSFFASGLVYLH